MPVRTPEDEQQGTRYRIVGWRAIPLVAACLATPPAGAQVLLDEQAALEQAFPSMRVERRTLYLTSDQVRRVEKAARSRLPSPVVTVFEATDTGGSRGHAILETFVVRTMPATVLTTVAPDGSLRMSQVLRFSEPPDYLPRKGWLRTLEGRELDDDLWPGRGVDAVSGATITVQVLTEAARRALAIDAIILREEK